MCRSVKPRPCFADEPGLIIGDPEHSAEEDRFILLGVSTTSRLLVVVHCYRASDSVIRAISARKADRMERQQYEGDRKP